MKILLSEDWASHIYAEPFFQRFKELGVEAHAFKEIEFFREAGASGPARSLLGKAQHRLGLGPAVRRLNTALLAQVDRFQPDAVFLFRGVYVLPDTLRAIQRRGIHVMGWQNDNPFGPGQPAFVWRHFVRSIPLYDRLWAYRPSNVEDFRKRGCRRVGLLRSFYMREHNFPLADVSGSKYRADVSFVGHWEPDGREQAIARLLEAPEIDFRLWGTLWERSPIRRELWKRFGEIRPAYFADYNLALNSTKIALVFLSRLNDDSYTRRCFEIPAAGTFMLSQYTPDLATLFAEGVEAEYFRDPGELLDKVRFYLRDEEARKRIARAGRERLLRDGHEAMDRARLVLATLESDLAATRAA